MLSTTVAQHLKAAGLEWQPKLHDFFVLPHSDLDERVFVMSDMHSTVEYRNNQLVVTFNGVVEWALDYVLLTEVLWLPTESQLREHLESRLRDELPPVLTLTVTPDGYRCDIRIEGQQVGFEAFSAADAYGLALVAVLERSA